MLLGFFCLFFLANVEVICHDHIMKIKNKDNLWFWSDPHFNHDNIIKYCDRPFKNSEEMNERLIANCNSVVKSKKGIVFCLGDFGWFKSVEEVENICNRLNGTIYFVLGNHDGSILRSFCKQKNIDFRQMFDIMVYDDEVEFKKQPITLCHYPMFSWNKSHRGAWQLFGHHHGSFDKSVLSPNQYEVSVECINYTPISYEKIKEIITKQNMRKD